MAKIQNFDSFWGCIPTFLSRTPDKCKIWHGGADLRGEKLIFGPLSKNSTGMAPLHAGLPVITCSLPTLNRIVQHRCRNLLADLTNLEKDPFLDVQRILFTRGYHKPVI